MYKPSFAGYVETNLTDKRLSLRSLIDHSVVENFDDGGKACITSRVYPALAIYSDTHLLSIMVLRQSKLKLLMLGTWLNSRDRFKT
ncbi:hypothetical protein MTR67_045525 [Solanum verrucosum]|uniref:Glycosyl hydrolase family 32 C-terminal domain-containing protein n=1 Tax=Solanum verrucosum TaxID=315347 RepID=A0AAF0UU81_SOLVR|nr:hypothetical protein MTR67_045525 [Solanum verrucosum]